MDFGAPVRKTDSAVAPYAVVILAVIATSYTTRLEKHNVAAIEAKPGNHGFAVQDSVAILKIVVVIVVTSMGSAFAVLVAMYLSLELAMYSEIVLRFENPECFEEITQQVFASVFAPVGEVKPEAEIAFEKVFAVASQTLTPHFQLQLVLVARTVLY